MKMAVFVNNPSDLGAPGAVEEIMAAVKSFEQAPGSVGAISTHHWLNAYMNYIGFQVNNGGR
jgi:hypothetical protein